MKIDVKFSENRFNAKFGEISEIWDGYPQEEVDSMVAAAEQRGNEAGKQAEYDRFWDLFQQNGNRSDYSFAFTGTGWTDATFKPKYDIAPTHNSHNMFNSTSISDLEACMAVNGVKFDFSKVASSRRMDSLMTYTTLTIVPELDFSNCPVVALTSLLAYSPSVKTVRLLKLREDGTNTLASAFINCSELENLMISGAIGSNDVNLQWSNKLTHDSLMSVINALQDKTGDTSGTRWTLTIGSENYAKLTDTEVDIARNKGWAVV